jgi:hypothetical protein
MQTSICKWCKRDIVLEFDDIWVSDSPEHEPTAYCDVAPNPTGNGAEHEPTGIREFNG